MTDTSKIFRQTVFCKELMERLNDCIGSSKVSCGAIEKHTVMQKDIIRLRRELMILSEMFDPYKKL